MGGLLTYLKINPAFYLIFWAILDSTVHASWVVTPWRLKETEDVGLKAFRKQVTAAETESGREIDMIDIIANHVRIVEGISGRPFGIIKTSKLVGSEAHLCYLDIKDHKTAVSSRLVVTKREATYSERLSSMGEHYYYSNTRRDRVAALYGIDLLMQAASYLHLGAFGVIRYEFLVFKKKNPSRSYPFTYVGFTRTGGGDRIAQAAAIRWAKEFGVYESGCGEAVGSDVLRARIVGVGAATHMAGTEDHKSGSESEEEFAAAASAGDEAPLLGTIDGDESDGVRHRIVGMKTD